MCILIYISKFFLRVLLKYVLFCICAVQKSMLLVLEHWFLSHTLRLLYFLRLGHSRQAGSSSTSSVAFYFNPCRTWHCIWDFFLGGGKGKCLVKKFFFNAGLEGNPLRQVFQWTGKRWNQIEIKAGLVIEDSTALKRRIYQISLKQKIIWTKIMKRKLDLK